MNKCTQIFNYNLHNKLARIINTGLLLSTRQSRYITLMKYVLNARFDRVNVIIVTARLQVIFNFPDM